ncbi:MAG: DUF1990 family protein [Planctomycetaceae bacterium]
MPSILKPTADALRRFLASQANRDFTYPAEVTALHGGLGYQRDHTRVLLGSGEAAFAAARVALASWKQFDLGWIEAWPADVRVETGGMVAVVVRALGLWWLNAARITLVIDESGETRRFGFAYGTLPGHAESGEERFLIEWCGRDDSVWYDILAYSRPRHWLARLGYPLVRNLQARFARESAARMQRLVEEAVA